MPHLTGVLPHRRKASLTPTSRGSSMDEARHGDEVTKEDETVMDEAQGSMLSHIISQLRPGADLSRVTLPTFILEPRSMLERITNFMAHPETMLPITQIEDPVQRFVAVTKFYLSGWHIKPPGVKKPLNPILGEVFTGYWEYPDGTKGYYISEQTSHHPPKSGYFFMAPEHNIRIDGCLKPRSKFLGNSAASLMEGIAVLRLMNTGERYFVTQPNMYARGILFGTMKYELGDHAYIRCPETGMVADLEFKTRGYFSGTYNAIGGFIKDSHGKNLFELSGLWNEEMYIKDLTTGKRELLFDASHAKHSPPLARPLEEQGDRESQKLWHDVTEAVKRRDQDVATDAKAKVEDMQREETAKRNSDGIDWHPQLFRRVQAGPGGPDEGEEDLEWIINTKIDGRTPDEIVKQVLQIYAILPGQKPDRQFNIPERTNNTHAATQQPDVQQVAPQQSVPIPSAPQPQIPHDSVSQSSASAQHMPQQYAQQPVQQPLQQTTTRDPTPQAHQGTPAQTTTAGSIQPTPFEPISSSQHLDQGVANLNLDGASSHEPTRSFSNQAPQSNTVTPNPISYASSGSLLGNVPEHMREEIGKAIPPSKLLNSNPEPEPRRNDKLRRMDSETREDEEFVDAQS